jgi:hypothetical protein
MNTTKMIKSTITIEEEKGKEPIVADSVNLLLSFSTCSVDARKF